MTRHLKYLMIVGLSFCLTFSHFLSNPAEVFAMNSPAPPLNIMDEDFTLKNQVAQLPNWARLVDIRTVNPKIALDIRYATTNNFLKRKLYRSPRCILRQEVAQKLSRVQVDLEKIGLGLKVFDCYRPLSVTRLMWEVLPDPRYVANPARGSRHNRGAAVDLTLVDRNGNELKMPTEFDDFTEKAGRDYRGNTSQVQANSDLLAKVMQKQGFVPLLSEWWHFDVADWQKFAILDVPFEWVKQSN